MKEKQSFQMTFEEFHEEGKKLMEWIACYQKEVDQYPVLSRVKPGEVRSKLPYHPPIKGIKRNGLENYGRCTPS